MMPKKAPAARVTITNEMIKNFFTWASLRLVPLLGALGKKDLSIISKYEPIISQGG